jgi:hypothetical protein
LGDTAEYGGTRYFYKLVSGAASSPPVDTSHGCFLQLAADAGALLIRPELLHLESIVRVSSPQVLWAHLLFNRSPSSIERCENVEAILNPFETSIHVASSLKDVPSLLGTDLDVLRRLHSSVDFLRTWSHQYPDCLSGYVRFYRELFKEAQRRFGPDLEATKLLLKFGRRLDEKIDSRCVTDNRPLPAFDALQVQEPLNALIDSLALDQAKVPGSAPPGGATPDSLPDKKGEVRLPSDPSAYLPAAEILRDHGIPRLVETHKQLLAQLKLHPEIRRHHPRANRLTIHASDWLDFKKSVSGSTAEEWATPTEVEANMKKVREERPPLE